MSASDADGNDRIGMVFSKEGMVDFFRDSKQFLHVVLHSDQEPITNLQVFICSENDSSPFVEITFFPEDIRAEDFTISYFVLFLDRLKSALGARKYYVRYENASWTMGDIGPASGVIFTSDDFRSE